MVKKLYLTSTVDLGKIEAVLEPPLEMEDLKTEIKKLWSSDILSRCIVKAEDEEGKVWEVEFPELEAVEEANEDARCYT